MGKGSRNRYTLENLSLLIAPLFIGMFAGGVALSGWFTIAEFALFGRNAEGVLTSCEMVPGRRFSVPTTTMTYTFTVRDEAGRETEVTDQQTTRFLTPPVACVKGTEGMVRYSSLDTSRSVFEYRVWSRIGQTGFATLLLLSVVPAFIRFFASRPAASD